MDAAVRPSFCFTVPGEAVPWARAGKRGSIQFTPGPQRSFMAALRTICAAEMRGAPPIDGPVELKIRAVYLPPASWSQRRKDAAKWKTSKPDLSNIAKIVEDALNTVAWTDDARIADLQAQKLYGMRAELVVSIRGLG